jgi:MerR family transcriptional regulator, redox-sensitive transcriptional activator SoxR
MNDATLTIGEVAQLVGLRTSAIRYYESIGILPEPDRCNGQRRYGDETVRRLQVIDIATRAGFSLQDAGRLLAAESDGRPVHEPLRDLAQSTLSDVEALIERAEEMRSWLNTAVRCGCESLEICPLFHEHSPRVVRRAERGRRHAFAATPRAARSQRRRGSR